MLQSKLQSPNNIETLCNWVVGKMLRPIYLELVAEVGFDCYHLAT